MIRLFISDIDGCLATPYVPFELERLADLRNLITAGEQTTRDGTIELSTLPAFSLCSGRSYPYVEAMTQVLGITTPVLFESGAGMFDLRSTQCKWHPSLTEDIFENILELQIFLKDLVKGSTMSVDVAKETQATIVGPNVDEIRSKYSIINDFVTTNYPALRVFQTLHSVDVVTPRLTKREGVVWLAEECGLQLHELAFSGDTDGDVGALQIAGRSYAPANAGPEIQRIVDVVTASPVLEGVFEAFKDAAQFGR